MRALIVDTRDTRASLAALRALSAAGWFVGVAVADEAALVARSRFARARHRVPPPEDGVDAFVEALNDAARGYEVVFAATDAEILLLSRERDRIGARVPFPTDEVMLRAIDKVELAQAATEVGIRSPATSTSIPELAGPLIVKERLHGTPAADGSLTHVNPFVSSDRAALAEYADAARAAGAEPIFQPVIAGRLMAFSSVVDRDGRMRARAQQIADRTYPRDFGLSARARTLAIDEDLSERVEALLERIGWTGLSQLQFLVGDEPILIDFNGRFYGSLSLAVAAGANLPDIWARLATGRDVPARVDARPGVRYQWLEGDLRAVRESSGGIGEIVGSLAYATRAHHSVWSAGDPLPAAGIAGGLARDALRKVRR